MNGPLQKGRNGRFVKRAYEKDKDKLLLDKTLAIPCWAP